MSSAETIPAQLKIKTIVVVLGIFLAGAATGVGFDRWARPDRRPPVPIHFFLDRLNLSAEQDERANAVIEAHRAEIEAIFHEGFPKIAAVNAKIEAEVSELLSADQRATLDRLIAEAPSRRHMGPPGMMHHRLGGPRGEGPPGEGPPPMPPEILPQAAPSLPLPSNGGR